MISDQNNSTDENGNDDIALNAEADRADDNQHHKSYIEELRAHYEAVENETSKSLLSAGGERSASPFSTDGSSAIAELLEEPFTDNNEAATMHFRRQHRQMQSRQDSKPNSDWPSSAVDATEGDPNKIGFLIALSFLQGAKQESIRSAATLLRKKFEDRLANENASRTISEPTAPRKTLDLPADRTRLMHLFGAEDFTDEGNSTTPRTRFQSSEAGSRLLDYFWSDFVGELSEDLREWVVEIGASPNPDVRLAIGSNIGALLTKDFDAVYREILLKWMRADTTAPHSAFGVALLTALDNSESDVDKKIGKLLRSLAQTKRIDEQLLVGNLLCSGLIDAAPELVTDLTILLARQRTFLADTKVLQALRHRVLSGKLFPNRLPDALTPISRLIADENPDVQLIGYISAVGLLDRLTADTNTGKIVRKLTELESSVAEFGKILSVAFGKVPQSIVNSKVQTAIRNLLASHIKISVRNGEKHSIALWSLLNSIGAACETTQKSTSFGNWLLKRRDNTIVRFGGNTEPATQIVRKMGILV